MKSWIDTVQNAYDSLEELEAHDALYGIAERCGFSSSEEMWKENPIIGGSVSPDDFGVASLDDIARIMLPHYKDAIIFTEARDGENWSFNQFSHITDEQAFNDIKVFIRSIPVNFNLIFQAGVDGGRWNFVELFPHDFWLTRNHHGAGFWDGDWKQYGNLLTEVAHRQGAKYAYLGDDEYIYFG